MVNIQFSEHSLKQRLAKILTVPKWTKQPIVTAKAFLQSLTIAQLLSISINCIIAISVRYLAGRYYHCGCVNH